MTAKCIAGADHTESVTTTLRIAFGAIVTSMAFRLFSQSDSCVNNDVGTGDEFRAMGEPDNGVCDIVRCGHLIER